jgi:nicotinamidase-related amidase
MSNRVWDSYLTDQDKELERRRAKTRIGFGHSPALLLVDNYRNVLGDVPRPLLEAIEEWPASTGMAGWTAIQHIQTLLSLVRETNIPVIHVTAFSRESDNVMGWSASIGKSQALAADGDARNRAAPSSSVRDDLFEIVDEVAPIAGEVVLRKAAPSCFFGTPLAAHLQHLKVDSLIVVGESTSGCVRATVVDAASYRYKVAIVEECVYDRSEASHAINLYDMNQKYADVISLEDAGRFVQGYKK